jgi:hypothetical protein
MTKDRRLLWSLLSTFVAALAVSVFSVVYSGQTAAENNRQWCELLTTLDTTYASTPPTTDLGKRVAKSINDLRESFGCD